MPTVNVSDEGMSRIERIKEHSKWEPSNREVVDRALEMLEDTEVPDEEQVNTTTEDN